MYDYITHMYIIALSFCITEYKVYDKIYYFVPINIPSRIKSNYIEGISKFSVEGGLPAGLSIDENTGDISGTATVKIADTNFKISFDVSGTSANFFITITGYVEKGLYVTYYKIVPPDEFCSDKYNGIVTEKVIRIEQTINYTSASTKWDGLTNEFLDYYDTRFEGFIYFDKTYEMTHKIVCDGACWVRINEGEIVFDITIVGKQEIPHIGSTTSVEYQGYSKFSINYRDCNNNQKLLTFRIGDNEDDITEPDYYFAPDNPIVYTYKLYTLKQFDNYPVNKPIIIKSMMGSRIVEKYELSKNLIKGLALDSKSGIISGFPVESTNTMTKLIIVNAYLDDGTIIPIDVSINVEINSGIALIDSKSGKALAYQAELTLGDDLDLIIYSDMIIEEKKLYGNLPNNLQFDQENGKIIGTVLQSGVFEFQLAVKTSTMESIQRIDYTLTIPQCISTDISYDDKINTHFTQIIVKTNSILPQKIQVILYNNNDMSKILDSLLTETPFKDYICTRNGIYNLDIYDSINSLFNIYINITVDGNTLYSLIIPGSDNNTININNKRSFTLDLRLIKPTITYPVNEIDWGLFDTSETVTPTITGSIQYFTIIPTRLPNDIYFNRTNGVISGTATTLFSDSVYTITATNILGFSEPFTITFKSHSSSCENDQKSLLHIYLSSTIFPEYMSVIIKKNNKEDDIIYVLNNNNINSQVNDYFTIKNSKYNKYICVPQDEYKIIYTSTHPEKLGWKRGYIIVYLYNVGLGRYTVTDEDEGKIFSNNLNLVFLVDSLSYWEYSTEYNSLWTSEKDMNWKKEIISKLNIGKDSDVLYLRKIIDINSNIIKTPAYYIQIQVVSGFIIYINGEEVFKKLIDDKNKRNLFMTVSNNERLQTFSFLFPISILYNTNNTVISIELHRYNDDDKNFFKFHFILIKLFSNTYNNNNNDDENNNDDNQQQICVNINALGKSKVLDAFPSLNLGVKGVNNAFDNDNSIGWRDELPNDGIYNKYPYVEYSFGDGNYYFINKLVVTSNSIQGGNDVENPKDVVVEGYDEMSKKWNYLGNIENIETKIPFQNNNISFYSNRNMYNKIRINITQLNQYNEDNLYFQVTNIGLFACDKYYCDKSERLPYTDGGKMIKIKCKDSGKNKTTNFDEFYCPYTKNPNWLQTNSTCEESPQIIDVIEKYVYYVGKDEGIVEFFKASGYIDKVTVYPELPLGLVEVTPGKYKGIVYTEYFLRSYLFTASNEYGYFNAVVQLEVVSPTEPNIINYIDSYQLHQYVEVKSLMMVFTVSIDLYYEITPKLPEGLVLNPFTGSISGVSTNSFSKIDFQMKIHSKSDNILTKKISLECISSEYPSILRQETNYIFYSNETYTNISIFKVAGSNLKYSVDPSLPSGLSLSSNGYISGKTTEINENPILYVFTVSNTEGVVTINIYLSFIEAELPQFISIDIDHIFLIGIETNDVKLFHAVGKNISYSIHPELPTGLSFNEDTGLISGKPMSDSYVRIYTITITSNNKNMKQLNSISNETSSKSSIINNTSVLSISKVSSNIIIGIKYSEKSILLNMQSINVFYKNVEISSDYILINSIGYNVRYIINSQLPSGLSFSETTGVLSGIPLLEDNLKSYNITVQSTNQNNNEINNVNYTVKIEVKVLYCKKDGRWPITEMGEKVLLSCTGTKSGNMYRYCVKNEENIVQPMWESTVDNCRISTQLMTICIVIVVVVLAILFFLIVVCFIKHHPIQPLE